MGGKDRTSWALIHSERERLAELLAGLDAEQWRAQSLCGAWTVEQVVAHLTAAASTGALAWMRSIVAARFDADLHNARRLSGYLGSTPGETLDRFRAVVSSTTAPFGDRAAWLGEVIVHGQDIARPLGVALEPDPEAVLAVAGFYTRVDFAVNSKTLVAGLSLVADDASFSVGDGPEVRGHLLDLVMASAGRGAALSGLEGRGSAELRRRIG